MNLKGPSLTCRKEIFVEVRSKGPRVKWLGDGHHLEEVCIDVDEDPLKNVKILR